MDNCFLSQLPDEIYRNITEYSSTYMIEIPRWNNEIKRWRRHCNVKCYVCKRGATEVPLNHICNRCCFGHLSKSGDNRLICWSCAH